MNGSNDGKYGEHVVVVIVVVVVVVVAAIVAVNAECYILLDQIPI